MKLVFISDDGSHHKKIKINLWFHVVLPLLIISSMIAISMSFGSSIFPKFSNDENKSYENFNSVINKLGNLEAEAQRINALGEYIASKSKLDINKFSLDAAPARGGANKSNTNHFGSVVVRKPQLIKNVKLIEDNLAKQKLKLKNLLASLEIKEAEESLASLRAKLIPKPKPIAYNFSTPLNKGYISSPYGSRRDPINGSLRHHGGLDIAAKKGTPVFAIANGFVTFQGKRGAYGNLLEINHSESLKSRYAHLDSFWVKKGQLVRKGDLIGTVGATGRVTGPHLHLEIKENGKIINPNHYLKDALKNL